VISSQPSTIQSKEVTTGATDKVLRCMSPIVSRSPDIQTSPECPCLLATPKTCDKSTSGFFERPGVTCVYLPTIGIYLYPSLTQFSFFLCYPSLSLSLISITLSQVMDSPGQVMETPAETTTASGQ
jgi:hypothetical protein